jgi:hypothetical protein
MALAADDRAFAAEMRSMACRRPIDPLGRILDQAFQDERPFVEKSTPLSRQLVEEWGEIERVGPLAFAGQAGAEELHEIYLRLRAVGTQIIQRHPTAVWLLLLRRLHSAPMDGFRMAPRWFIEQLIRHSYRAPRRGEVLSLRFRIGPRVLEDVHDALMSATAMWNVSRAYRSVNKGAIAVEMKPPAFASLGVAPDPTISRAMLLYDIRQDSGGGSSAKRQGIMDDFAASMEHLDRPGAVIPIWRDLSGFLGSQHPRSWRTRIYPLFHSTTAVFAPVTEPGPPSTVSLGSAALLWACWREIERHMCGDRLPRGPWCFWGVIEMHERDLRGGMGRWAAAARQFDRDWKADDAWEELRRAPSRGAWADESTPVVLRSRRGRWLVDLLGASELLDRAHERPSGGPLTNRWTRFFEDQVQSAIDDTDWSPGGPYRALIRKTIRERGQPITDIDAVGYSDGTLLLCDGKAWVTSIRHDQGDYDAVRTRRRDVEVAESQWRAKVARIRSNPALLGVDSSNVREIAGVVVCPDVPYVLEGPCTDYVLPNLYAVATLRELHRALGSKGDEAAGI